MKQESKRIRWWWFNIIENFTHDLSVCVCVCVCKCVIRSTIKSKNPEVNKQRKKTTEKKSINPRKLAMESFRYNVCVCVYVFGVLGCGLVVIASKSLSLLWGYIITGVCVHSRDLSCLARI